MYVCANVYVCECIDLCMHLCMYVYISTCVVERAYVYMTCELRMFLSCLYFLLSNTVFSGIQNSRS